MIGQLWDQLQLLDVTRYLVLVLGPDFLPTLCLGVGAFMAGVCWSAYKALDWVERVRTWALTAECPSPGLAGQSVDSMGWN